MEPPFIDIHTHGHTPDTGVMALRNVITGIDPLPDSPCSAGIHPRYLTADTRTALQNTLVTQAAAQHVLAIGECGLDKRCDTPFDVQQQAFDFQIGLARMLRKPLLIHQVRAIAEVTKMLDRNLQPVIIHGFRKNGQVATRLLDQGYYLSFGAALLYTEVANVFKACPPERLFLETDGAGIPIRTLYEAAAAATGRPLAVIRKQISRNFETVFGTTVSTIL